jgi:hypothetical protein
LVSPSGARGACGAFGGRARAPTPDESVVTQQRHANGQRRRKGQAQRPGSHGSGAIRHWPSGRDAPDDRAVPKSVALSLIKTVHAAAFLVIAASGQIVFWDGVLARPSRRTGVAAAIVLAESAVFAANGFVCPLTPMAERLGARRGSVSDIFLPDVVARNLTWITGLLMVAGTLLNARAIWRRRRNSSGRPAH